MTMNNENTLTSKSASSNFGHVAFNINKISFKGVTLEGFNAKAEVGYTDDGLRAELDASMQMVIKAIFPFIEKVYADEQKLREARDKRDADESAARTKFYEEQAKCEVEQTTYYHKQNEKLDLEIENLKNPKSKE